MTEHNAFSGEWWEQHYRDEGAGHAVPGPHLQAELADLAGPAGHSPGSALDAGCGAGADARWLAEQGWQVTAVDVSPTVVREAEKRVAHDAPSAAKRITWIAADLTTWEPPQAFELVVSQYVHPAIPFRDFVRRLADAVAPGGTLLVTGHDHADHHSAAHAPADASMSTADTVSALDPATWEVLLAETRTRERGSGAPMVDVVVRARRRLAASATMEG